MLDSLIAELLHAEEFLSVSTILKKIEADLTENTAKRPAFCKELSRILMDWAVRLVSYNIFDGKPYSVVGPRRAIAPYLTSFGFRTGRVRETMASLRKAIGHIDEGMAPPSGKCLSPERAEAVLEQVRMKYPYFEIVRNQLAILLLDNSHKVYNSHCGVNESGTKATVLMYHMRDMNMSPEYVFLHELGHVLQVMLTHSIDLVPEEFIAFHDYLSTGLKQGAPDAPEVFADSFAIAVMRGTDLQGHSPFDFGDELTMNIERFFVKLFAKYTAS